VLCRSMADLHMLITDTPQGRYPYAGTPWYSTTFGRDGLITALQMLWFDPTVARGVLRRLANYQAKTDDPAVDAQPGKILHEMRSGEMAALNEIPFGLYYGSVDATPLFVLLACLYAERTGDVETLAEMWPNIEAALRWIDGPGDPDQDGFVEYLRASEHGLANQGWKDSHDAVFHADGRTAKGHIALAEVQGYVFAAKQIAARWARRLGHTRTASRLDSDSKQLAKRFEAAFWCPEIETYALALDGEKEPCRVRTSNAGQLLFTGILAPDRAATVANGLLQPQFFSGWGIRTLARGAARYNPMSYHNGSIWPHDNALIALGLARYGLKRPVERIFKVCSTLPPTWSCAGCPSCSAAFNANAGGGRRSIRSRVRRKPGRARRHSRCSRPRSAWSSINATMKSGCGIRHCPGSSTKSSCAICGSVTRASISGCVGTTASYRSMFLAGRAESRSRWCFPSSRAAHLRCIIAVHMEPECAVRTWCSKHVKCPEARCNPTSAPPWRWR
jgi:glycogen debranching enzyme